jgi:Ca-activated chloride channel family protein
MKISLSILLTALTVAVSAQDIEVDIDSTYFHPAASMYVQGDSAGASNLVYTGLSIFPDNGKLLRLKELLDQQQEQENQDQQNQDQQNEDQQDKQDQNQDQEQNQDQQNQDQNQDQQNEDQQNQDQQDQQNPDQPEEQNQDQGQQPPPTAEQMSQDEAERLLDAMKQEEENKRLQLHPVMGAPVRVDKDW